ncbi:META domain-containing protein [Agromyces aurantiacus]|uniref:META domain-containing protein n=1 Tax=Agromyces aurantiacus TaxID=165814 RepID=A0ABV9R2S7_9MICO|nr:META domain-containing protein [Agromyces aurantiacus]MBM7503106.1 heat shock protein HslJ [Agromyces aurantiacus]
MDGLRGAAVIAGIAAALVLAGCAGEEGEASGGDIDPTGTWGDSSGANTPYLTLEEGGGLTGSDGCNRLRGTWSVDEADQIEFENVASTKMACQGVDTWLSGLSVAEVSDDTMTVLGADGAEIGQLQREG